MYVAIPLPVRLEACKRLSLNYSHQASNGIVDYDFVFYAVSPEGSVELTSINNRTLYLPDEEVTLNCNARGGPNNTFTWFFDDEVIQNTMDTLTIHSVEGGQYTCQVSNTAGSENASITLIGISNYILL